MRVIQTCVANLSNPFDYMVAVVKNQHAVKDDPGRWMPWKYKDTLTLPPKSRGPADLAPRAPRPSLPA